LLTSFLIPDPPTSPPKIRSSNKAQFLSSDPPGSPPKILSSNKAQFLSSGDTLTCTVSGGEPLVSSVHFSCSSPDHPDGPDDRNGSSVSSSLTIDTSRATGADTLCVCSAVWEPGPLLYAERVEETYHLDYGPLLVSVEELRHDFKMPPSVLTLICVASRFQPAVTFTWSGVTCNHSNQSTGTGNSSTCSFALAPSDVGKNITCTASNTVSGLSRAAAYTLTAPEVVSLEMNFAVSDHSVTLSCRRLQAITHFEREFYQPTTTYSLSNRRVNLLSIFPSKGAPQLVESNSTHGTGTKDNPFKVSRDGSLTFYLQAYPTPVVKIAGFLGNTLLPNNSDETDRGFKKIEEEIIRCWPSAHGISRVQCEVNADQIDGGFYAVTLANALNEITLYLHVEPRQPKETAATHVGVYAAGGAGVVVLVTFIAVGVVKRRRYLAMRARYARFQHSPAREMVFYRRLGEAVGVQEEEDVYHVIDYSHMEPGIGERPVSIVAPLSPRLRQDPLPPIPCASGAATFRRRSRSLTDDSLHPVACLSDRRAADNSAASRSHRRRSLPSDYMHLVPDYLTPVATLPYGPAQDVTSDYLTPTRTGRRRPKSCDDVQQMGSLTGLRRSVPPDYLHPAASRGERRRSLPSDYIHPIATAAEQQPLKYSDYVPRMVNLADRWRPLPPDYIHPAPPGRERRRSLPSDYIHPTATAAERQPLKYSDYVPWMVNLADRWRPLPPDYIHPAPPGRERRRSLPSDYIHPIATAAERQPLKYSDYVPWMVNLADRWRPLPPDYIHPAPPGRERRRSLPSDYIHPITTGAETQPH
ncbi:hypothetical protein BaRGS_00039488, partial [Batillaria attramentaria]